MSLSILMGLRRVVGAPDVAIDLGTANTRLYAHGFGLIADEPSLVRVRPDTGLIEAVGARAAQSASPDQISRAISPLRAGVVADVEAAASLLRPFLRRARRFGLTRPRALACAPTDAREEERAALAEATCLAGASSVVIAPEPLAAAIGSGLDISSPYAQMVVDVGDGVTDIAVIRSARLVGTAAIRTACSDIHAAVHQMVEQRYGVSLYPQEAEGITQKIGAAREPHAGVYLLAAGTHRHTGREARLCISSQDVSAAIAPIIDMIIAAVRNAVRDLPPKTSVEVIENGICLTGGGAQMHGLASRIAAETGLDVHLPADPLRAVINGARQMLAVGVATHLWMH